LEIIARLCGYWHYGNTAIEKRAIFFKRLLPLLDLGREREGIDLSKVVLTHHHLENRGKHAMPLSDGDAVKLYPIAEAGSGGVQVKEKAWLKPRTTPRNSLPTRRISRPASQRDHGGVDAHTIMSTQALNSATVRSGIKDILLNHAGLYESLRQQAR
jgi:type I restriction enzyme R subunit